MATMVPTIIVFAAFTAGAIVAWFLRGREIANISSLLDQEHRHSDELRARVTKAENEATQAKTQLSSEHEAFERERTGIEQKMLGQFQSLAHQALGQASASFLELAAAKLGEERQAVRGVIAPVQTEFEKFSQAVAALQQSSSHDLGALKTSLSQVAQLQTQLQEAVRTTNDTTGQLRNALQNPRIAGNWGEISLDRIVELAGMTEHCDFDRQTGIRSSDGSGERPDLMIRLTGGLRIPVDAKTSATNYVRSVGEQDENERKRFLRRSALDLRSRITELRARAYDGIEGYAGMTILFVPNEAMVSSAFAQETGMMEEALRYGIVICSPLLLLCYLRAFANGWRLQKQQENAEEVARRGRMLYERLQSFFVVLAKVGKYLNHTVEKFNDGVAKMDTLLVPGRELGKLLSLNGELQVVNGIDTTARGVPSTASDDARVVSDAGAV